MKRSSIVLAVLFAMFVSAATTMAAGYSMQITFTNFNGRGTLTNFPALVKLDASNTDSYDGFLDTTDGWDLRFWTNSALSGDQLNYEIESFDTNSTSFIWVQVPELTHNGSIWASWGDATYNSQASYTTNGDVWTEGYVGVWHLGNANDSGTNGYDGTVQGDAAATTGVIDSGYTFDGVGDYIDLVDHDFTDNLTVMAWARRTADSPGPAVSGTIVGSEISNSQQFFYEWENSDNIRFYTWGTSDPGKDLDSSTLGDSVWYHFVGTYDGSFKRIYTNGVLDTFGAATGSMASNNENLMIGYGAGSGAKDNYFYGQIDEVRVSNIARSTNWIWASYMTQGSDHESFVEYGSVTLPDGISWTATDTTNILQTSAWTTASVNTNLDTCILVWEETATAPDPGPGTTNDWSYHRDLGTPTAGTVTAQITNLTAGTVYVWRFYGESGSTNEWSGAVNFSTIDTARRQQ